MSDANFEKFIKENEIESLFKEKKHNEYVSRGIPENIINILEKKKLKKEQISRIENLPWESLGSKPDFADECRAQKLLDEEHIGMDDVKDRIMDYYCSQFKNGATILLVGPPGVGKTSIAFQIAKACNRSAYKVSLSGIASAHEIIGVDSTFSDAAPGEIIRAIENTGSFYPLVILDEIDKVGHSKEHGDPHNALLEVLDTNRENFRDRFLEIPIDLSNFIFIATANDLTDISPILRDRLEIIEIGGYSKKLKKQIFTEQIIPKIALKLLGESNDIFEIGDDAFERIINEYCIEPGIRELYDYADKMIRRANRKNKHSFKKIYITAKDLEEYIGKPKIKYLAQYDANVIGSANAAILASTKYARILKIHTEILTDGVGEIICTGGIEGFAKESVEVAKSLVRHYSNKLEIPSDYFLHKDIHVDSEYYPIIKNSSCIALAIFVSMVSTILEMPIPLSTMFAAKLRLDGSIEPVANIDEYIAIAIECNLKNVYISAANVENDTELIKKYDTINIHPVKNIDGVLSEVFKI